MSRATYLVTSEAMPETWRPCHCTSFYEVSSLGRIKSLARKVRCGPPPGTKDIPECILGPTILTTGYLQVKLHGKKHLLHRLIAEAFLPGDPRKTVNHKNGVKTDNRIENLEWATHSENQKHKYRVLGCTPPFLGKFGLDHPKAKPITFNGETRSVKEWARLRGWKPNVIYGRVRMGWPISRILTQPVRKSK